MRVTLNIPDDDIDKLNYYSRSRGIVSRSAFIRRIIQNYLSYQKPIIERLHKDKFGKFSDLFEKTADSLDIQSDLRKEWE